MKPRLTLAGLLLLQSVQVLAIEATAAPASVSSPTITVSSNPTDITTTEDMICKGGVCIPIAKTASIPGDDSFGTGVNDYAFIKFRQQAEQLLRCTTPKCLDIALAMKAAH